MVAKANIDEGVSSCFGGPQYPPQSGHIGSIKTVLGAFLKRAETSSHGWRPEAKNGGNFRWGRRECDKSDPALSLSDRIIAVAQSRDDDAMSAAPKEMAPPVLL